MTLIGTNVPSSTASASASAVGTRGRRKLISVLAISMIDSATIAMLARSNSANSIDQPSAAWSGAIARMICEKFCRNPSSRPCRRAATSRRGATGARCTGTRSSVATLARRVRRPAAPDERADARRWPKRIAASSKGLRSRFDSRVPEGIIAHRPRGEKRRRRRFLPGLRAGATGFAPHFPRPSHFCRRARGCG